MRKLLESYLNYCEYQRMLSSKTLKAYRTDILEFFRLSNLTSHTPDQIDKLIIYDYIKSINNYSSRTIKRKIASIKAFFRFLEREDFIENTPFRKVSIRIPIPRDMPKTLDIKSIKSILLTLHKESSNSNNLKTKIRDLLIVELLFNTGIRVSELCNIKYESFKQDFQLLQIRGKGNKERSIPLTNKNLKKVIYQHVELANEKSGFFILNQRGVGISDQSVRNIVKKYAKASGVQGHITPHVFRHTFATILLEQDTDIRYIQNLLGHSSITTTELYTSVSEKKKRQILELKGPRNLIHLFE